MPSEFPPIAVVGVSAIFPGSTDAYGFWRDILAGKDLITDVHESRVEEEQATEICDRITNSYVPWQENTFPGLLGNVVAGRIANRFNLGGTNCVIDAACASSLSALAMAVDELHLGHSDLVITG